MVIRQDVKELLSRGSRNGQRILSVYLDIDQGRALNLNRGFEAVFKSMIQGVERSLDDSQRKTFMEAARRAGSFLADYAPSGKSLVYFGDSVGEFEWNRSVGVSLDSKVCWASRPCVRPLLEARDEYERSGIILTDRAHARFFTVFLGEIEEREAALATADVKKFDASGSDQMRSQMNFQRKADEHARRHLKHVAEIADRLLISERLDRVVIAGTQEAVSELKGILSERLKKSLVGTLSLPIEVGGSEVLSETMGLLQQAERENENSLVSTLLTAAAKNHQAVKGLEPTLSALSEGRIRQLVYGAGLEVTGGHCPDCDKLFDSHEQCPLCQTPLRSVADLLEAVVSRVFEEGGEIEQLRGDASTRLAAEGDGIGAFLRF
jgi:peptide chain release factor subunit 1